MLRQEPKQLSLYGLLYNKIPEKHILKKINSVVDFSFINELLKDKYSLKYGRPAKEPEMMCRLLILQHLYDLSDERVIQEASLNLAYMFFIGVNPEDTLPDKSLLAKFRKLRLNEDSLDQILQHVVVQCVQKKIITGLDVGVDTTHIEANTIRKTPERLMGIIAKKILKSYEKETKEKLENIPDEPDYKAIENHDEAKAVMKTYLEDVIKITNGKLSPETSKTTEVIQEAEALLGNPEFIKQTGIRSIVDKDARVGHKSKEQHFFGYKTEIMMTTDEQIITSVRTEPGNYTDGDHVPEMLVETAKRGIRLKKFFGDKAYFRKPILDAVAEQEAESYIPVSETVYKLDESQFSYVKDSDEWVCSEGHHSMSRKVFKTKCKGCKTGFREGYTYYFDKKVCSQCPKHDECAGKTVGKILRVGRHTGEFYDISQRQKSLEFKEEYKKRACLESKNAELKRFHGLYRARGYGLRSVAMQVLITVIAVNLKRIVRLLMA